MDRIWRVCKLLVVDDWGVTSGIRDESRRSHVWVYTNMSYDPET